MGGANSPVSTVFEEAVSWYPSELTMTDRDQYNVNGDLRIQAYLSIFGGGLSLRSLERLPRSQTIIGLSYDSRP
jgi:hypothetical protein